MPSAMEVNNTHLTTLITHLILSCLFYTCVTAETNLTTDQSALLALKARITSDPNGVLNNWTIASSVCDWNGVSCGLRHRRVTGLNISSMGLCGSIPPDLGNLSFLQSIDIKNNNFNGTLPEDLARLRRLNYVRLSINDFTREVPSWLSSFPKLKFLSLAFNGFTSANSFIQSFSNESMLEVLVLSFNPFQGEIPNSIGNLRNLKLLSMRDNGFSGSIPLSITNISSLEALDLTHNSLQGTIPWHIFDVPTPEYTVNNLSGKIPSTTHHLQKLRFLSLGSNMMTGVIPPSLCNLNVLEYLDLSYNSFGGTLPDCLGNVCEALLALDWSSNDFHGPPIPTTFMKGRGLLALKLNDNQLEGLLPQSLARCTQLRLLDIGNNKIHDYFPRWLENLSELRVLFLSFNRFHGIIPNSKKEIPFPKMHIFDISNNNFTGLLPVSYVKNFHDVMDAKKSGAVKGEQYYSYFNEFPFISGKNRITFDMVLKGVQMQSVAIQSARTLIDLSNNKFYGNISYFFGNLTSLRHLNLSHNNLSGQIPNVLGFLTKLEALDLSSNHLNGKIPRQLTRLWSLSIFNVSYNNLSGQIPQTTTGQFPTFDNNSYIGNFGLCGFPLTKICQEEGEQSSGHPTALLQGKSANKSIFDGITCQGALVGYAFGALVGVIIGIIYF